MTIWLCWHVGTVSDPKLAAVAKRCGNAPKHLVVAVWAYLLEIAAVSIPKGSIASLDVEGAAIQLDCEEEQIVSILEAMESKQMIGGCQILNWNKRQHGKSTERVKAFRERKKQDETPCNVSETEVNVSDVTATPTIQDNTIQDITGGEREGARTAPPPASPEPDVQTVQSVSREISEPAPDPLKADDELVDDAPPTAVAKRGTRLPAAWMPSAEDIAFCRTHRPDLDPGATADAFRDYWIAKAGSGGVKLDWHATWRTWVRRQNAVKTPAFRTRDDDRSEALRQLRAGEI